MLLATSHLCSAAQKKFQVAGRTKFYQLFLINPYVIGVQKLPVAGPKNMHNL